MTPVVTEQIPLPFAPSRRKALDAFYPGPNAVVLAAVRALAEASAPGMAYLHGAAESGKSHLLQGTAARARESGRLCAYLPLGEAGVRAELLPELNARALLCIDNVDRVAGDVDWERRLLDLYERSRGGGGRMLFAASAPPAGAGFALADLVSRLAGQPVFRVRVLSEAERADALAWEARRRGLQVSPATVEWLMRRVPRGTAALFALLDRVDRASLEENRRLTIPFLRSLGIGETP